MKRGLLILIAAVALGAGMFVVSRAVFSTCNCAADAEMPMSGGSLLPELEWLRHSLRLTDGQFEKVKALHLAYQPTCEELCARVHRSNLALMETTASSGSVEGEVAKHLRERADLTVECQRAMLHHVYETAACMNPEQARQYLRSVLPHAFGLDAPRAAGAHSSH